MYYDFWMMASMTELVDYPDEANDDYVPHPNFQAIMDALGVPVPIEKIYERFFDQPIHSGHVLVFANKEQPGPCIVLDTYRDPLDQLDMIRFGWRSQGRHRELQRLSRQLYEECEFSVRYEEGQSVLYRVLQEDRYPRKFYYNTVFEQRLKRYWVTPGQAL